MMAQKHLHELLKEDQEPFQLERYVADRRRQPRYPNSISTFGAKKAKPSVSCSSTGQTLCRRACLFSFTDSPDVFLSPSSKSPNGSVLLHVPARTSALLIEAAIRIQKQSSQEKSRVRSAGAGLFGSILRRLKDRSKARKPELSPVLKDDDLRTDSLVAGGKCGRGERKRPCEAPFRVSSSCNCNTGRLSSAWWSESNEDKSLEDLETSSSCGSEDSDGAEFAAPARDNGLPSYRSSHSCPSPSRSALPKCTSGTRTPEFLSPAASPIHQNKKVEENYEVESLNKDEEKEEKEQCSPVSVLEHGHEDRDDSDNQCSSYAILQRAKQKLLYKLSRFERLAELNPDELEKIAWDDQEYDGLQDMENEDVISPYQESNIDDEYFGDWFCQSGNIDHLKAVPLNMKRLVLKGPQGRSNTWKKEMEASNIGAVVDSDLGKDFEGWKKHEEQIYEMAMEIELALMGFLVEECMEELG